ncbi:MAG: tol-pal system protein YbgF, partial [Nitrospiraceae bacterium]
LTMLERRLAYVEVETQGQVAGGRAERPSQQSKTAKLDPQAAAGTSLSERPGLTPTSAYNLAYNDYLSGRYELAVTGFQRFVEDFPSTSLTPNAYYWLGESYYSMKDYVRAMQAFERVIKDYPKSEKVPPALYKLGLAAGETGDTRRSRAFLKRVIQEYKDSNEAKLAKNRLAELQ